MTDSTENAAPPKSTKSRNSNSLVQIQTGARRRMGLQIQIEILVHQNLNLNLYREIPRDLSFSVQQISEMQHFQ